MLETQYFLNKKCHYPWTFGSHNLYDENATVSLFYRSAQPETLQPFPGMFRQINGKLLPHPTPYTLEVKNPPANSGDISDVGSIPGSGRSPGEGNGNSFQYACLGNPMDREAWQATVHRAAESDMTEATKCACILPYTQMFIYLCYLKIL